MEIKAKLNLGQVKELFEFEVEQKRSNFEFQKQWNKASMENLQLEIETRQLHKEVMSKILSGEIKTTINV